MAPLARQWFGQIDRNEARQTPTCKINSCTSQTPYCTLPEHDEINTPLSDMQYGSGRLTNCFTPVHLDDFVYMVMMTCADDIAARAARSNAVARNPEKRRIARIIPLGNEDWQSLLPPRRSVGRLTAALGKKLMSHSDKVRLCSHKYSTDPLTVRVPWWYVLLLV